MLMINFSVVFKHCANDIFGVHIIHQSSPSLQEISHRPFVYVKSYKRRKFFYNLSAITLAVRILMERERLFLVSMQVISSGNADFFKSCSPDLNATVAKEGIK